MKFLGWFIITLVFFGILSIGFMAFDKGYDQIYSWSTSEITDSDSLNTIAILNVMWKWLPLGILFSFFLWVIMRNKDGTYV